MPTKRQSRYAVQVYERLDDRILPTERLPATSAEAAVMVAEGSAELFGGAVALHIGIDEAGEVHTVTVLAKAGELPEGWAEGLMDDGESASSGRHPRPLHRP